MKFLGVVCGGGGVHGLGGVGGGVVGLLLGVDSLSLVGDVGGVSVVVVGDVGHDLGPAVGKGNTVGSRNVAGRISSLLSAEGGLGVVISNTVGVGVGSGLLLVGGSVGRGVVGGGGMVDNRGSIGGGGMVHSRGIGSSVVDGMGNGVGYNSMGRGMVDNSGMSRGVGGAVMDGVGNRVGGGVGSSVMDGVSYGAGPVVVDGSVGGGNL